MKVVLLSGKQGSGKTSVQKLLCTTWEHSRWAQNSGHAAAPVNFADVLYEMHDAVREVQTRYGMPLVQPKDGRLLQLLGTEIFRARDPDVWVNVTAQKIAGLQKMEMEEGFEFLAVIGDCRFENEFHAFPDALRVRLDAPEEVRKARCTQWRDNTEHLSEIGLDHMMEDKFDLYLATDVIPVAGCVDMIMAQLLKNTWKEKRKCL